MDPPNQDPQRPPSRTRPARPRRVKSGPQPRKCKVIYSVDDDVNDPDDDDNDNIDENPHRGSQLPRSESRHDSRHLNSRKPLTSTKYLEGYQDAMRQLAKSRVVSIQDVSDSSAVPDHLSLQQHPDLEVSRLRRLLASATDHPVSPRPDPPVDDDLHDLNEEDEPANSPEPDTNNGDNINEDDANSEDDNNNDDDDENTPDNESQHSTASSSTLESLNLKDRQNAINKTHPFGIKIWKPSLYKKSRSVAARANEDIHDFDPRRPTGKISWGVHVSNFLWSISVGLFLYLLCVFGAVSVFVLSGFAWHKHSRPYVKQLFKLGRFWLYPFGKFVLLNKDKNYRNEDELDGRSISEFHKWRLQEEGRLFFAPPRKMTGSGNEHKPLLKDHRGRSINAAYSSLGEGASGDHNTNSIDENAMADDDFDDDNVDVDVDSGDSDPTDIKRRLFGRGAWSSGRFVFYVFFYVILTPILFIISVFAWLFVFTIPISNLTSIMYEHLRRRPLALHFENEKVYYKKLNDPKVKGFYQNQSIILCTYRCCGLHYYKYTYDGTNIFFINLLAMVVFVIFDYFVLKERLGWDSWYTDSSFLFCACLCSIIPLAYFIGQAVASISAQSSMGVGAVINAFFSTIVEIFLYCVALEQAKGKLVEGSMIGSILAGVLLLPGLSMCGGAIKRKTQRYNPRSAGVSSTMLLFAMVTMFTPSLFYQMYGSYEIKCKKCEFSADDKVSDDCTKCRFIQPSFTLDKLYYSVLMPFSVLVALALFLAYVCGLFFTLRTHASLIWATTSHEAPPRKDDPNDIRSPSLASLDVPPRSLNQRSDSMTRQAPLPAAKDKATLVSNAINHKVSFKKDEPEAADSESSGHDAPNWSRNKSTFILLGATVLYAVIAEILVDNVDSVLKNFPINPKFLGLTVFALVPNTTEFVNAISFAVGGNVALSMEIGSAYALQVVLIQIPSLVIYSIVKQYDNVDMIFSMIFSRWDIIATLISIYLFTYIYAEGKSNYFKGVILCLIYTVVLVGFYLDDVIAEIDDGYRSSPAPSPPKF